MKISLKTMYKSIAAISIGAVFLFGASSAFAHVVVRPNEVGVAAFQTFTIGVPVEKDIPTVGMRLVIPDGLQYVTPNVKQGWDIEVKKEGEGEEAKVTEIVWTRGMIPAGQRDEFLFSAQVPASETTLAWKAYQTYEDGSVVSWDQDPSTSHGHGEGSTPYSETKVINDLSTASAAGGHTESQTSGSVSGNLPFALSIASIALSTYALVLQFRKKK